VRFKLKRVKLEEK